MIPIFPPGLRPYGPEANWGEAPNLLFVSIFQEDEIDRLSTTLSHIKSGSFPIIREEVYFVEYPYTDDQALYHHFIDSFMLKKNAGAVEKMKTILGSKKDSRPIVVRDKVNIFLLKY